MKVSCTKRPSGLAAEAAAEPALLEPDLQQKGVAANHLPGLAPEEATFFCPFPVGEQVAGMASTTLGSPAIQARLVAALTAWYIRQPRRGLDTRAIGHVPPGWLKSFPN